MNNLVDGLAHIGIPCTNLEKSILFYAQFSFTVVVREAALNGYHTAMLDNGNCRIELYESVEAHERATVGVLSDGHIDHLALRATQLDALYEACLLRNIPIVSKGIESTDLWQPFACRYFIIRGPDGERIEFAQIENI